MSQEMEKMGRNGQCGPVFHFLYDIHPFHTVHTYLPNPPIVGGPLRVPRPHAVPVPGERPGHGVLGLHRDAPQHQPARLPPHPDAQLGLAAEGPPRLPPKGIKQKCYLQIIRFLQH